MCIAFYALLVFLATFFSMKIIREIGDFAMSLPDLFYDSVYPLIWDLGDQIQLILEPIDMTLAQLVNEVGKTLASTLAGYATKFSAWAVRTVATGAVSIPGALIQLIIIVVSSFYMAADYQTVIGFLTGLIPRSHRDSVVKVVSYARTAVVAYIKISENFPLFLKKEGDFCRKSVQTVDKRRKKSYNICNIILC